MYEKKAREENGQEKVTIPVFDGEDYNMWKKRLTLFIKLKECDKGIKREK